MRLLLVTTAPVTLRAFLLPYAEHFRKLGWTVDAVTGQGRLDGLQEWFDSVVQVPWSRSLTEVANVTRAPRAVRRIVKDGGYDIVHTHTPIASLITRAAVSTLQERPAVVYTAHGFHFHPGGSRGTNAAYALAEKLAGRWTDRLIVINEADARAARQLQIVPAARLLHLPGVGIDLDWYAPTPALLERTSAVRARLEVRSDARLLTMVAEMQPGKNHRVALEALARSPDMRNVLVLAGEGPLHASLEEQARRLGVRDRVRFLGFVDDVRPLILASVATVLPSVREGLSRAVLESLALGVPVIGGNVRGVAELVGKDGGILVDPHDPGALGRAYDEVAALPSRGQLRPRLEQRLRRYSLPSLLQRHEQLYDELQSERLARRPAGGRR